MDAVIFDLDGTLLDSRKTILRCLNTALAEFGRNPFEENEFHHMIGMHLGQILTRRDANIPEIADRYTEILLETFMEDMALYDGVPGMLAALLDSGYALAAATMRRGGLAREILRGMDLADYFLAVFGSDDVAEAKPSGIHVLAVCESLGTRPEDVIVVGDSKFDILSAKAAGCLAVGVTWGSGYLAEMEAAGADNMIHDMAVLSEFLRSMR